MLQEQSFNSLLQLAQWITKMSRFHPRGLAPSLACWHYECCDTKHPLFDALTPNSLWSPSRQMVLLYLAFAFVSRAFFNAARRLALMASRAFFFSTRTTWAFSKPVCLAGGILYFCLSDYFRVDSSRPV
ncbi:hypothetical protein BDR22DRAFT_827790 [Usnea florida]